MKESDLWKITKKAIKTLYPKGVICTEYEDRDIVVFNGDDIIELELTKQFNKECILQVAGRVATANAHYTWAVTTSNFRSRKYKYYRGTRKVLSALGIGHIFIDMKGKCNFLSGHEYRLDVLPIRQTVKHPLKKPVETTMFKDLLTQTPGVTGKKVFTNFKAILEKMYYEIRELKEFTNKEFLAQTKVPARPVTVKNYLMEYFFKKLKVLKVSKRKRVNVYTYIEHSDKVMREKILNLKF